MTTVQYMATSISARSGKTSGSLDVNKSVNNVTKVTILMANIAVSNYPEIACKQIQRENAPNVKISICYLIANVKR